MKTWVLSIIPDIRSETSGTNQGKMHRHFSSKVNFQPDRSVPPKFRLQISEVGLETRIFVNRTARFVRTGPTGQRGPAPEVVPNIPVGLNRNGPFHLTSARNFWKFWQAPFVLMLPNIGP